MSYIYFAAAYAFTIFLFCLLKFLNQITTNKNDKRFCFLILIIAAIFCFVISNVNRDSNLGEKLGSMVLMLALGFGSMAYDKSKNSPEGNLEGQRLATLAGIITGLYSALQNLF